MKILRFAWKKEGCRVPLPKNFRHHNKLCPSAFIQSASSPRCRALVGRWNPGAVTSLLSPRSFGAQAKVLVPAASRVEARPHPSSEKGGLSPVWGPCLSYRIYTLFCWAFTFSLWRTQV